MNMDADHNDQKPGEYECEYLSGTIVKAMSYADDDPETALIHARKAAEAICTTVFAREIGNPGSNRLDKLIELLSQKDKLPERIKIPLRVIQQYGNYAAHFQADQRPIDRVYIDPCLSALVYVTNWYFLEFLGTSVPSAVAEVNNEYEPHSPSPPQPTVVAGDQEALAAEFGLPSALRPYQWEGVSFLALFRARLLGKIRSSADSVKWTSGVPELVGG